MLLLQNMNCSLLTAAVLQVATLRCCRESETTSPYYPHSDRAELRKSGEVMPIKDSLIAATALVHDFIVVTRNTNDFRKAHVKVLDPFPD